MPKAARFLLLPFVIVAAFTAAQPPPASSPPAPSPPAASMAALGDSITRALAVCCSNGDNAIHSWSTGDHPGDGVTSHYERLGGLGAAITGRNHNNAISGSRAVHLPGQAEMAVKQNVEYVTILTGANDLCTSSAATMTLEADFAAHITTALSTLHRALPGTRIFVGSIPDLYQLWKVLEGNAEARDAWAGGTCPSMLSVGNTEEQRQVVVERELAFNRILAQACSRYKNCRWDNNAVYDFKFSASDVSDLDYFHPSLEGQARLAELTWRASWWGNGSTQAAQERAVPISCEAGGMDLEVSPALTIPTSELSWRFSRSSGPGGQHVNTSDSRVELSWNVANSLALSDSQRLILLKRLGRRVIDGVITVTASEQRSQLRNREIALAKLSGLVANGIAPTAAARRATKPTRGSKRRHSAAKKQRAATKRQRKRPSTE